MNYGFAYQGGKSGIAAQIISTMPAGKRLVDLFGGGGAITHCALLSGKYESVLYNDINPDICKLFEWAISGKLKNETRWISREDFFRLKDSNPYVRNCWSFGNNNSTYCYGKTIEPYKKACHYAIVFNEWAGLEKLCPEVVTAAKNALDGLTDTSQRRIAFGPAIVRELNRRANMEMIKNNPLYRSCKRIKKGKMNNSDEIESLQTLQSLECLESLERLERFQRLDGLQRITITNESYEEYVYKDGDVVYCDPPYNETTDYSAHGAGSFDFSRFSEWALSQTYPIYISSYELPPPFILVNEMVKAQTCGMYNNLVIERLYTNIDTGRRWTRQMYFDFME